MREIDRVAVLGAGTMGADIALSYAKGGVYVSLYTRSRKTLVTAESVCGSSALTLAEAEVISESDVEKILSRIHYTNVLEDALTDADFILETIVEFEEPKRELYETVDRLVPKDIAIASNTSDLNIFELMPERRQKTAVITHWFMPAHIIPLVEIVRGPVTTEDTMRCVCDLLTRIGKLPLRIEKYTYGFIINKLQNAITREMMYLIDNGYATPADIDIAVKASIIPRAMLMGLFQTKDFNGLDVGVAPDTPGISPLLREKLINGDLGVKTGRGWYDYTNRPKEEVFKKRDLELIRIFKLCSRYINNAL